MIKSSIEQLSESIGFDIGTSDDIIQSNLLNGFCRGIANSIKSDHDLDLQICCIVDKLNPESHKIIKILYDFIELKEKNKKP